MRSLSVSRTPPLGMFFHVSAKRRAHSGRHCQSLTVVPTKSLQNSGFIGRAWPHFLSFYSNFQQNSTKRFLRYRRFAIHARFVALSYGDFHVFVIPRHNGDRASPFPRAPFDASRVPLSPALFFLSTICHISTVPCITRRRSSLRGRRRSHQCLLRGSCSGGQMEGGTKAGTIGSSERLGVRAFLKIYMESVYSGES